MTANTREHVSLIIPVFNEQAVLALLFDQIDTLMDQLDVRCDVILVNDGSTDSSLDLMRAKGMVDPRYKVINLSRNFGHQIAISAGLDAVHSDAAIIMDADLQDPPEIVLDLVKYWQNGAEVVSARRRARKGETLFKRVTAKLYYRLLSRPVQCTYVTGCRRFSGCLTGKSSTHLQPCRNATDMFGG